MTFCHRSNREPGTQVWFSATVRGVFNQISQVDRSSFNWNKISELNGLEHFPFFFFIVLLLLQLLLKHSFHVHLCDDINKDSLSGSLSLYGHLFACLFTSLKEETPFFYFVTVMENGVCSRSNENTLNTQEICWLLCWIHSPPCYSNGLLSRSWEENAVARIFVNDLSK